MLLLHDEDLKVLQVVVVLHILTLHDTNLNYNF